jgi:hypothetical protein
VRRKNQLTPENLWNRLARNLIYDSKQVLLYCGIQVPRRRQNGKEVDYSPFIKKITKGTGYGAIYDPSTGRIHFEPDYIQDILDTASRFDFPVFDKSFGPGGIAGFIHEQQGDRTSFLQPSLSHILQQAMTVQNEAMPFGYVSARQINQYEVEQFGIMTKVFNGPTFFNVATDEGFKEAAAMHSAGHYIITNHSIFMSPLTLSYSSSLDIFCKCVEESIPTMLVTQPFSGQTAPMTPYGLALLAFAEFIAAMAMANALNPETKIINGAYPTMCTPGNRPQLKIGSVVHNYVNYLVAYTARLLDIASIQSGCTMEGSHHENTILETDYETVRAMILWENLFDGWHMLRHCFGFLEDLASFSFRKAEDDIAALHHIQSLDENGIMAVLANNVQLNRDYLHAEKIYNTPTLLFQREKDVLLEVILETMEVFNGDFGKHDHTLKNIPNEWF